MHEAYDNSTVKAMQVGNVVLLAHPKTSIPIYSDRILLTHVRAGFSVENNHKTKLNINHMRIAPDCFF